MQPKNNQEFLTTLFGPDLTRIWVTDYHDWTGAPASQVLKTLDPLEANYFAAGYIRKGASTRSNASFEGGIVIVLDDVGEKASPILAANFAPPPTYKIMTSEGNEQWGYVITPVETDAHRWHAFYELLRRSAFKDAADNSGLAAYKRLPFGLASKPEKKGFNTHITYWSPDTRYDLTTLAAALGFELTPEAIEAANIRAPFMGEVNAELMSQDLLTRAMHAIPNDKHFEPRDMWVDMGHSIFGASGGAEWGYDLWIEWCDQVYQNPGEPERFWRTLKPRNIRSGAGYIRQQLDRLNLIDLYTEAKLEGVAFEQETGFSESDDIRPQGTDQPKRAKVRLIDANEVEMEAISWVWDGYLAEGKLQLLAGPSTAGKTTVALALAAITSNGGVWPDGTQSMQGNVVVWSGEDDIADTLAPRLAASGADLRRIKFLTDVDERGQPRPFDPSKDMPALASAIDDMGGARLLIIDPIVSAVAGDAHKANEVRRGLQPVIDLAMRNRAAVIGITHLTKDTRGKSAQNAIIGSQAFGALSRINLFCFTKDGEDGTPESRTFARGPSNIGPSGGGFEYTIEVGHIISKHGEIIKPTHAVFGAGVTGSVDEILARMNGEGEQEKGRPPVQSNKASEFLMNFLKAGAKPAAEVQEYAREVHNISLRTLMTVKYEIGIISQKRGHKWWWMLPEAGDEV